MFRYFSVGHNTPGYSPETEPYLFTEASVAVQAMVEDLDGMADFMLELDDLTDSYSHQVQSAYEEAIKDVSTADVEAGWSSGALPSMDSEHDLGVHFWITPIESDVPLTNEGEEIEFGWTAASLPRQHG